ncbi:hypothetical protein [Bordetella hinzii]|uniref:hypothetical protein n=1 Tax=Bordetella hinzii TaxID=103855 RepID=UPI001151A3D0|nr:hypothetical protein [Bordetella hinzii]QDJ49370.1 hypothetical protein CBR69_03060 [Bordetella hinzii]
MLMCLIKPSRLHIIFLHRFAALTLLLVLLHQSMIAASAYFLTEAIGQLQAGQAFQLSLLLYFASMILPFIPGCLSYVTMQAWANAAHARLLRMFELRFQGRTARYRDAASREEVDSVISRNAFSATFGYIAHIYGFASFSLNSLLSLVVIAYLLPPGIWQGYVISVIACAAVIAVFNPGISRLSETSQAGLAGYGHILGRFWSNVTLGNRHNLAHWQAQAGTTGRLYYRSLIRLEWLKQSSNFLLGLVTLIPTSYLIYETVTAPDIEPALIAATLVNLTRIFHILNSLGALVYQILEFGAADAAFKYLLKAARLTEVPPAGSPAIAGIRINDVPVADPRASASAIQAAKQGRFTVRGPNGSGKSTFLLEMKGANPDQVFYLPSSFEQLVWQDKQDGLSTGQRMMRILAEIRQMDEVKVLLLDEWDANLDQENTRLADDFLDALAREKVVVEVRH